jgi:catechol 2,3-dioxygenase-like lactoylglutathione lyase family enzyme
MTATTSRPRVKKLLPSLGVSDIRRSVLFYRDVFGFEVVDSFENEDGELIWCWLRAGVGELMLQQLDPDQQITLDPAIGQSWCLYLRTDDILATRARLRAAGLDVSEIDVTGYGARECFATDPDGYVLWLSEPEQGRGPDDEDDDEGEGDAPQPPMH